MNPDRNVQLSVALIGELPSTSPVRRLFVVPTRKKGGVDSMDYSKSAARAREVTVPMHVYNSLKLNN